MEKSEPIKPASGPCQFCGKPADIQIAGKFICLDCYVERGSCCQEQD